MAMAAMALSFTGCGERTDIVKEEPPIVRADESAAGCPYWCTCSGCVCYGTVPADSETVTVSAVTEETQPQSTEETQPAPTETAQVQTGTESPEETGTPAATEPETYVNEIAQLTDVEQEQNGVYYYDRGSKFDMKRVSDIFRMKAEGYEQ